MAILATKPVVVAPTDEVVCDKIYIDSIVIQRPRKADAKTSATIKICHWDGNITWANNGIILVPDVDSAAALNPNIATAFGAIIAVVQDLVRGQGL